MGLYKDKIIGDYTTPANADSIVTYLYAGDGTAVTQSGGALDVNLASQDASINIADGGGSITVDGSVTVSATDLDIRDLTHVSDSVSVGDGTDLLAVNADGSINVVIAGGVADDAADSGNPIKVGSRAYDGALAAISASNDRADLLSDMYRRVWVNNCANVASSYAAASVTDTASELAATPLSGRTRILIQNLGSLPIYVGNDASVTTSNGIRIGRESMLELPYGEDLNVYAITSTGTQDVRIFQLG